MSTSVTGNTGDASPRATEDGVVSPTDQSAVTMVNCSVNHSSGSVRAAAEDSKDPELGVKSHGSSPAAAVNTTVRYRSERRRWSNLERYLCVVCVVLLLTTIALAVIVITSRFIQTGQSVFIVGQTRGMAHTDFS